MGRLYYAHADAITMPDDTLAYVRTIAMTKLRRNESFTLSWRHEEGQERGRETLWLHPSIPLRFVFDDPEPAEISRDWIEELARSAHSSGGIVLLPERPESADGAR